MMEDLIKIFIKEFQKCNLGGICVLGSWLFNQYIPDSKIVRGFLIRKNKNYCLHVWVEYKDKIYDIGNMYNMRIIPMTHLLVLLNMPQKNRFIWKIKLITIKNFPYC